MDQGVTVSSVRISDTHEGSHVITYVDATTRSSSLSLAAPLTASSSKQPDASSPKQPDASSPKQHSQKKERPWIASILFPDGSTNDLRIVGDEEEEINRVGGEKEKIYSTSSCLTSTGMNLFEICCQRKQMYMYCTGTTY